MRGATSGAFKSSLPFVKSDKAHEQLFRHLLYKDLTLDVSGAALTPELFKEGRRRIEEKANKSLKNAKEANTIKEQVVNARGERRKELLKSNLDNLDDKKLQKEGFAVSEMDPKGQSFDLLHKNNKTGEETIPFATVTHLEATGKVSLQFSNANPKNEETVKAIMALSVFAPSPQSQIRISNASPAMAARLAVQIMASGHQPVLSPEIVGKIASSPGSEEFFEAAESAYDKIMAESHLAKVSVKIGEEREVVHALMPEIEKKMAARLGATFKEFNEKMLEVRPRSSTPTEEPSGSNLTH